MASPPNFTFYLGTHEPSWLEKTDVPLFISRRRLARRTKLPRALGPWALDSGGFSELSLFGDWTVEAKEYVREVRLWREEIGNLQWASVQDWMAEPWLVAKTGLSVRQHQERTVRSCLDLLELAPEIPWMPVLQGWRFEDYVRHIDDYHRAGIDLAARPYTGIGSICRRQATGIAEDLARTLAGMGITAHAFGMKLGGVLRASRYLGSADSLAWSLNARKNPPLPGCPHRSCQNCLSYALHWRQKVLRAVERGASSPEQFWLFSTPRQASGRANIGPISPTRT